MKLSTKQYHAIIRRKGEENRFQWAVTSADGAFVASGELDGKSEDQVFGCALKTITEITKNNPVKMEFDLRKDSERK